MQAEATSETPTPDQQTTAELAHRDGSHSSHQSSQATNFEDKTETYESLILHNTHYLCTIPLVSNPTKNETFEENAKADEEKELARASDRGWELLKDMEGHCMYFISGWWSYSFCYNTKVKQFHQLPPGKGVPPYPPVEDPATPSYVLGTFTKQQADNQRSSETESSAQTGLSSSQSHPKSELSLQTQGSKRYLMQKLSGGTTCDLTGRDRRVEVQFHCHPQSADRIGWIKEVTTCSYMMVIYTPRLCNDIAFLPPREHGAHAITCQEIVPASEAAAWESRQAASAHRKLVSAGTSARPVIGNIEVGGMKQVGKEGRRLEPPQTSAAPDKAKTDLVAKMHPLEEGGRVRKLSNEDIRKMGFDPKDVDALLKEIQKMAQGKGWRVELVDVGGDVRELRGVVEADEEEGEREEGVGEEGEGGSEEVYKDEL